ncbi:TIGR04438 family Trp-rich protein [Rhodoferax sp.]|uniref:TIGR04438 family Trp-rich protein n=1 Tax=Rhodoferax sp. TaxID=50421 RepID=UPI0026101196|nr:TIGR04438 family Trp-rich protein [Rhodoferax sp.]MDD5478794.1 TIGR04438 family Trp-rich protein [Rhodoferax sp.]
MYFLGLGVMLLVLKVLAWEPVASLSWWWVALPYVMAVAWWAWADSSGYTKRKAMDRENQKRDARRERTKEALGTINRRR